MRIRVKFRPLAAAGMASESVASRPRGSLGGNRTKIPCAHEWKRYTIRVAFPAGQYPGLTCKHCALVLIPMPGAPIHR